jgi:hypothetical protein
MANVRQNQESTLWDTVLEAAQRSFGLRGKLLKVETKDGADATICLSLGNWTEQFHAEFKLNLRPQTLGLIAQRVAAHGPHGILITDHVTPPMAELLRAQEIRFLDAAGNAYIQNHPVHVWVKGERPLKPMLASKGSRAFTPSGLQVILALLCRRKALNSTYRHFAVLAGVAHGTVGWVMPELERLGFLTSIGGKRALTNVDRLLDAWTEGYLRSLRPRLLLGRFRGEAAASWTKVSLEKYGAAFSGEVAASRLDGILQPATVTVYATSRDQKLQVDFRLRKDEAGNVELLRRFWSIDPSSQMAPLPVVYADLVGTGDARCIEAARPIRERIVAGPD